MDIKLEGGNIIEHMRKLSKLKEDKHRYFYFKSPVMKAIINHICSKNCCLITIPPDHNLKYYRGHGPVSFKDAFTYGTQYDKHNKPYEIPEYCLTFTVAYVHKDDYDDDFGTNVVSKKYEVHPPVELELNFTQKAFDKWAKQEGEKRKNEEEKEIIKNLEEMSKLHPDAVRRFLKEQL